MSRYRFQQQPRGSNLESFEHFRIDASPHNGPLQALPFPIPTRKQINSLFEKCPEASSPLALLTPRSSQPSNDPRYRYLLNRNGGTLDEHAYEHHRTGVLAQTQMRNRSSSGMSASSSSSSSVGLGGSNPSPSSTVCTSTSLLELGDEEVKKMFLNEDEGGCPNENARVAESPVSSLKGFGACTPASTSASASCSSRFSSSASSSASSRPESLAGSSTLPSLAYKPRYEPWMLNPGVAAYASAFAENIEGRGLDEEGEELDTDHKMPDDEDEGAPMLQYFDSGTMQDKHGKGRWQFSPSSTPHHTTSFHHKVHILPPPRPQATAPPCHLRKPWHPLLEAGCRASGAVDVGLPLGPGTECSRTYATRLVKSRAEAQWGDDALEDLVQAFVWKATLNDDDLGTANDSGPVWLEGVAKFAQKVKEAFADVDRGMEERFAAMLRSMVVGTFVSCWHAHPTNRHPITYDISSPNRTPRHLAHVRHALKLCSFIGNLYRHGLLSRLDTIGCIRILLLNMSSVEHLSGIENILRRAGTMLWREAVYPKFLSVASYTSMSDQSTDHHCSTSPTLHSDSETEINWSNLDSEIQEFESQIRVAKERVQDHQYLLRDLRTAWVLEEKLEGVVKRRVDGLIGFVRECRKFVTEGVAGDGRYCPISDRVREGVWMR